MFLTNGKGNVRGQLAMKKSPISLATGTTWTGTKVWQLSSDGASGTDWRAAAARAVGAVRTAALRHHSRRESNPAAAAAAVAGAAVSARSISCTPAVCWGAPARSAAGPAAAAALREAEQGDDDCIVFL